MKSRILETIVLSVGGIITAIVAWIGSPIQHLLERLPTHILIRVLVLLLLWSVLLLAYVVYLKIKYRLKQGFGVLWNRNKDPYCPIHEKPLARHKFSRGGKALTGVNCLRCKATYPLITDGGKLLSLEEAKRKL